MISRPLLVCCLLAAGPAFAADAVDEALSPGAYEAPPARGSVAQLSVPLLRSPVLERRWGAPRLTVAADGSYVLTYRNPRAGDEHLTIVGTRRPIPVIKGASGRPAHDGETTVAGQRIGYFAMGNDFPAWQTGALALASPGGRRGGYVLVYGARKPWPGGVFPPVAW